CRSGNRSAQASAILSKVGRDVRNVGGGMNDWITAGYPVTR
ncbi:rhodanese-like domain-containing protein, partial [Deinococcus arenicola]